MKKFKFEETIKAKESYRIFKIKNITADQLPLTVTDLHDLILLDGSTFVMGAQFRSFEDFIYECVNGNNEAAGLCEMFITKKGNKFIYWRDYEADEDYLTKYEEAQNESIQIRSK